MGSKLPASDLELYRRVDEVLHYVWDPIGVATQPGARDEYHSYLPRVFELLKAGANAEDIAACLTEIATVRIGLAENPPHDLEVAELLLNWKKAIGA